jgi:PIN domain nuclease of toxin-antitoxin system
VRVVADSHALYFYLFSPDRLSERALEVLGESEDSDGIVASVVSLADLWYVDNKAGGSPFPPGAFESLRHTLLDPATNFHIEPVLTTTMEHYDRVPLAALRDPFDRFILATASQLRLPLVTKDEAITATGAVEIVW